jgi:hypothetical protein
VTAHRPRLLSRGTREWLEAILAALCLIALVVLVARKELIS